MVLKSSSKVWRSSLRSGMSMSRVCTTAVEKSSSISTISVPSTTGTVLLPWTISNTVFPLRLWRSTSLRASRLTP